MQIHRFLIGGSIDAIGICGGGLGGREDQKSQLLYTFTPLLQESRGPPEVGNDT
jgi:hypothetical protein